MSNTRRSFTGLTALGGRGDFGGRGRGGLVGLGGRSDFTGLGGLTGRDAIAL
jgi:hypothetical protein